MTNEDKRPFRTQSMNAMHDAFSVYDRAPGRVPESVAFSRAILPHDRIGSTLLGIYFAMVVELRTANDKIKEYEGELATRPDMEMDVRRFMHLARQECPDELTVDPGAAVEALRMRLMQEELDETVAAMRHGDIEGIADGIADLIYVALGTAIAYGIDFAPVWREVQRANMDKLDGPIREDGKQLKPEGWKPPDIRGVLEQQAQRERKAQEPL